MLYLDAFLPEFRTDAFWVFINNNNRSTYNEKQETFEFLPPFLSFPSRSEDVKNKV